eukprot:jgi/Botrbrau1/1010/Bobra.114_1s0048.1
MGGPPQSNSGQVQTKSTMERPMRPPKTTGPPFNSHNSLPNWSQLRPRHFPITKLLLAGLGGDWAQSPPRIGKRLLGTPLDVPFVYHIDLLWEGVESPQK